MTYIKSRAEKKNKSSKTHEIYILRCEIYVFMYEIYTFMCEITLRFFYIKQEMPTLDGHWHGKTVYLI